MSYSEGDKVKWKWGKGTATGKVERVYTRKTTRKIDGTEVTRKGSQDCPAYYITQQSGGAALKLHSEVERA